MRLRRGGTGQGQPGKKHTQTWCVRLRFYSQVSECLTREQATAGEDHGHTVLGTWELVEGDGVKKRCGGKEEG